MSRRNAEARKRTRRYFQNRINGKDVFSVVEHIYTIVPTPHSCNQKAGSVLFQRGLGYQTADISTKFDAGIKNASAIRPR